MKEATTFTGHPIIATEGAPKRAVCPYCGGTLELRSRRAMKHNPVTYFWRHMQNKNRHCKARRRPF